MTGGGGCCVQGLCGGLVSCVVGGVGGRGVGRGGRGATGALMALFSRRTVWASSVSSNNVAVSKSSAFCVPFCFVTACASTTTLCCLDYDAIRSCVIRSFRAEVSR